ncbi:MAG TPA: MBL fold metallo-hydrolase [Gemmatimonadales bacterium]|nr:MBL fold metallo-hydrolase [Gemmatimonadales bacterium]
MSDLEVVPIPNGQFAENCYLLATDGRAVIIDPGEEWERFLAEMDARGVRLEAIWLTHAHLDHILGVAEVQKATGAPIWLHPADRSLYDDLPTQSMWLGFRSPPAPPPQHELAHGQVLSIGDYRFDVRHAPGHSPGSVCFVGSEVVFSGDALFNGSIGRSDLPGGDHATLIASIRRELLSLPDATRVLSGHGPATTIGAERRSNPFLR